MSKSNRLDDWRRLNARRRAPARARLALFMDDNGELVMGPARPDLTMVAFRWAWRYRNELWPFYAVLGLATIAGTAHDHAARLWPLGLLLGGAITAAAWRWRTNRLSERVYVLAVGGAATLWTAAAWWASPAHGLLVLGALAVAVGAGAPRWWYYRRRRKITVRRGAPRGARRELRRIVKHWPELAEYMELAGSHVQRAEADTIGYTFTLALRAGLTVADVMGKLPRVESVLGTRPGAVRLLPDLGRADHAFLRVVRNDPLSASILWPGTTATSVMEPIALGRFEDGETVRLELVGEHVLIGGATGRGKSGVLNVILAELSARADVVLWGIDMKGGLELAPWSAVLDRLATTADEAVDVLTAAGRVLDARARLLAGRHERTWRPTAAGPALVVLVDELAELSAEAVALLERLARLGRAVGIVLVAVTQRPSAAALGGLDARTQMTVRVALGVIEARDGELILGAGRLGAGWRAERLSGPGYFLVLAPGRYELPRPARAYWLDDHAVRTAAGHSGAERTMLDSVSAEAAERSEEPSEGPRTERERGPDPHADAALLAVLDAAQPDGLSADELAGRVGRSRAWVFMRLSVHEAAGRVAKLRRGRWTGAQPGASRGPEGA